MRNSQFINYYGSNDRLMPNGDPTVLGFPCRFPAAPPIRLKSGVQVIDQQ
jgi:hypothetical protein